MDAERTYEQPVRAARGLWCGRYVRGWGKQSGLCGREAIAVVLGVPVCYVHAPVEARRWRDGGKAVR
jgi:hypothetical protein